jgi:hypothetical protein
MCRHKIYGIKDKVRYNKRIRAKNMSSGKAFIVYVCQCDA